MKILIMRGIPGSGKTTWLRNNHPDLFDVPWGNVDNGWCSADHYHLKDGIYQFDPANIQNAHACCLRKFMLRVVEQPYVKTVAVDNTNLTAWECAAYYYIGELYTTDIKIVTIWTDFLVAAKRNTHGVPIERVAQMHLTMLSERLPPQWKHEMVLGE